MFSLGKSLLSYPLTPIDMTDSSAYSDMICKSCKKSLIGLDELILMFDHIRYHDANHFNIASITKLVDHFEKVCEKFKENTSHSEAERLVRFLSD